VKWVGEVSQVKVDHNFITVMIDLLH